MKFFHLSDLHIGKQLHHYNLREDQEAVLMQVAEYAGSIRPDAVVIAGDIYDRSVPSAEAVTVFDEFLTRLSAITPAIPILIISGMRLRFLRDIRSIWRERRRETRQNILRRLPWRMNTEKWTSILCRS